MIRHPNVASGQRRFIEPLQRRRIDIVHLVPADLVDQRPRLLVLALHAFIPEQAAYIGVSGSVYDLARLQQTYPFLACRTQQNAGVGLPSRSRHLVQP